MEQISLDYFKIKKDYDLQNLTKYGFNEPQPKENVWWQKSLVISWTGGIGKIIESLNVNKDTKEIRYCRDNNVNFQSQLKDLLLKLTYHLESTENSYNKILEEINKRTNNV